VRRKGNSVRLVIALSVAAALAVFLVYTSFAGVAKPSLRPSQLRGHRGQVMLAGQVVGPVRGDAHADGMRFRLKDIGGSFAVPVVYKGSVPDLFRTGRHIFLQGEERRGTFVGVPGSLVTKCPSKYAPPKRA
jgi:cytochrome c-type biogenesis protein CcmE